MKRWGCKPRRRSMSRRRERIRGVSSNGTEDRLKPSEHLGDTWGTASLSGTIGPKFGAFAVSARTAFAEPLPGTGLGRARPLSQGVALRNPGEMARTDSLGRFSVPLLLRPGMYEITGDIIIAMTICPPQPSCRAGQS